jgi:hypothetical protein
MPYIVQDRNPSGEFNIQRRDLFSFLGFLAIMAPVISRVESVQAGIEETDFSVQFKISNGSLGIGLQVSKQKGGGHIMRSDST